MTLRENRYQLKYIDRVKCLKTNDAKIASLDPLNINDLIKNLPEINRKRDVNSLISLLYSNIPFPDSLENFDFNEAIAVMRDIGFFIGSIKRHNIEPVEAIPELDYILDVLSVKTDLPPRDTLMHYTIWNPEGENSRCYTHYKDESNLISSIRNSYRPLVKAIYIILQLHNTALESEDFEYLCQQAANEFQKVIEAIVLAKKDVSAEVFAKELRFYFDPIFIHGKNLIGPGAVEMPMFVYDHLLWSSDIKEENYVKFKSTYLPFCEHEVREVFYNFLDKQSLLSKTCQALYSSNDKKVLQSAKALFKLCRLQISFRMPHKKIAESAYRHQEEGLKKQGSGGYTPEVLSDILDLNMKQLKKLHQAIEMNPIK